MMAMTVMARTAGSFSFPMPGQFWRGLHTIWAVVTMMVPFWIPIIMRHLIFRVPQKGS